MYQSGCLTTDISVRLHSCERGTNCEGLKSSSVVWITPIITRTARGVDVRELGAGGGGNDFEQVREIEVLETSIAFQLAKLCSRKIVDVEAREKALALISNSVTSGRQVLPLDGLWNADELEDMPLETFATLLGNHMEECTTPETVDKVKDAQSGMGLAGGLPTKIVSCHAPSLYLLTTSFRTFLIPAMHRTRSFDTLSASSSRRTFTHALLTKSRGLQKSA